VPPPPPPATPGLPTCADWLAAGYTTSGVFALTLDGSMDDPIDVYCDMTTDGGGWIKLTSARSHNYWKTGWTDAVPETKCGNDGYSTQTGTTYQIDYTVSDSNSAIRSTNANMQFTVEYRTESGSGTTTLTDDQMDAIRASTSQLSSTTAIFGAACDDDGEEDNHESYAQARDGTNKRLTDGSTASGGWTKNQYFQSVDMKYLLPHKFVFQHCGQVYGCGGAEMAGWRSTYMLVK